MKAQEIIEKIRAEIEKLKELHKTPTFKGDEYEEGGVNGYQLAIDKLLSVLSGLEKEEKPFKEPIDGVLYAAACGIKNKGQIEKSEKPMEHKDIDTEICHWMSCLDDKYCVLVNHYSIQDIKDTARHFAKWGAEHAKK